MLSYIILAWMFLISILFIFVFYVVKPFSRWFQLDFVKLQKYWAKMLLLPFTIEVEGIENFNNNENYLIYSNHQGYLDVLLIASILNTRYSWMAKVELFNIPVFGKVLYSLGHIAIERENKKQAGQSLIRALEKLKNKSSLIIFPEGTWNTAPDKMLDFKDGFYILAKRSKVRILPIVLKGCHEANPSEQLKFNPGKLKIIIKKAISYDNYSTFEKKDFLIEMKAILQNSLLEKD